MKDYLQHEKSATMLFANCHRIPSKQCDRAHLNPIVVKFIQIKDRDSVLRLAPRLKNAATKFGISPLLAKDTKTETFANQKRSHCRLQEGSYKDSRNGCKIIHRQ